MTHQLLQNERLRLRAVEEETDLPLLYSWENDSEHWGQTSNILHPIPTTLIRNFVVQSETSLFETKQLLLMIEEQHTHQTMGYVQLMNFEPIHQRVELGVYIASSYRKIGVAQQSLSLLIRYAQSKLRCFHFVAQILESNRDSRQLFQKLGFEHTATLPQWYWSESGYQALCYYQLWSQ